MNTNKTNFSQIAVWNWIARGQFPSYGIASIIRDGIGYVDHPAEFIKTGDMNEEGFIPGHFTICGIMVAHPSQLRFYEGDIIKSTFNVAPDLNGMTPTRLQDGIKNVIYGKTVKYI